VIFKRSLILDYFKITSDNLCSLSANLGDTRTIVTHPASTTHSKLSVEKRLAVGISDGLVRVSVGLETLKDVIADLNQALS
jgi:O-succinylhomoserine sulfhydrylase